MTEEQETFGAALRRLRILRGLSQPQLAEAPELVEAYGGRPLTGQAVSEWERDNNFPKNRDVVQALDNVLHAEGELLAAGGYASEAGTDTRQRLNAIEAELEGMRLEVKTLKRDLRRLLSQQRRAGDS